MRGVSLTHPVLAFLFFFFIFLSGVFLLHIPCLFDFSVGSFSYTSDAGFNFFNYYYCLNLGSFSNTSGAGF